MATDKGLVKTLTKQLEAKQAEATNISNAFKDEDGKFVVTTEQRDAFRKTVREAEEIKSLLDAASASDELGAYLQEPVNGSEAAADAGARGNADLEGKSLGEVFIGSDAYRRAMEVGVDRQPHIYAEFEGKSLFNYSAGFTTVQSLGSAQNVGLTEFMRRKFHIRDLFPKSTTRAPILYGVRETGWVNNAAQVPQRVAADDVSAATGGLTDKFARAPRSRLLLQTVTYPVAEVAHLLDAHKNILSDESRLQTFINTRMVEGVKFAEDYDLLHSVGGGERITGLFNTPGTQSYTGLNTDKYSVQIRRAITKALIAEYDPSGIVVSPTMWEQVEVEEDNTGAFRVATSVAIGATKSVWRLNVVETTAIEDTKFLIGAFGMGAQLHDRETVSVKVSTENADNLERGVVTFRADERLALEVPRPESFVIGTWTTPV